MSEPAVKLKAAPATTDSPTAPESQAIPVSAKELRRQRARRLARRFLIGVGLPTLIAIVYSGFVAAPQYDARAVIAIESNEEHATTGRGKDSNAGNQRDARLLREWVRSHAVLDLLVRDHGFVDHYATGDVWARLDADAGSEDRLDYYRDKVFAGGDREANVVHLRVRAFSGEAAHRFAAAIVAAAEGWVAELSRAAADDLIGPAEAEVARARDRLVAARRALADATAASAADADLRADPATIEHELAQRQLDEAVEALQQARLDAAATARRLVVIAAPSVPTEASRPRVAWDVATVLVTSAVLVAMLSLLGAAIREHANF